MTPKTKQTLIDRLKGIRADLATLQVYTADADKALEVAVPNVRQKWQRVQEVLDEVPWTMVEALDKKKAVLLVHNRGAADERPAGDLEELGAASGEAGKVSALLAVSVHWVLRAQDVALTRQQESASSLLDAQNRLLESTMRRYEQMDRQYNEMMRLNHAMHGQRFAEVENMVRTAREAMAGEDGAESDKLIQGLLPSMIRAVMDKPTPTDKDKDKLNGQAKPNGVPPKKAAPAQ